MSNDKKYIDIMEQFSDKFPVFDKTYKLYEKITGFSKKDDDTLKKSAEITILEILELVVIASRQSKSSKEETLRQASTKLDTLKVFAGLAKDMKAINDKAHEEIVTTLNDLGRMLGGWRKAVRA